MTINDDTIEQVWNKGRKITEKDPDTTRADACGTEMSRDDYGDRNSAQGWEVDHIDPNGGDDLSNLQPLQWENNISKGDGKLKCNCSNEED